MRSDCRGFPRRDGLMSKSSNHLDGVALAKISRIWLATATTTAGLPGGNTGAAEIGSQGLHGALWVHRLIRFFPEPTPPRGSEWHAGRFPPHAGTYPHPAVVLPNNTLGTKGCFCKFPVQSRRAPAGRHSTNRWMSQISNQLREPSLPYLRPEAEFGSNCIRPLPVDTPAEHGGNPGETVIPRL